MMRYFPPALSALLTAVPAYAQTIPCAPRDEVLRFVIEGQGEVRQAVGAARNGAMMELYAGDSGSWTLLVHLPDGRSCLLAHGESFQAMHGLLPALGLPA